MKTAVDLFQAASADQPEQQRKEWTGRSVIRLCIAVLVMTVVYFLASSLPAPVEQAEGSFFLSGFALFWVLGGLFTITLLALSDRRG